MARIRSIKPELFDDPDIGALSAGARWLFVGLLTQADRRGRLIDDSRRLKVRICAFDDADVGAQLTELAAARMIVRYEADGCKCIQIRTFEKHQKPHPKEPESTIPANTITAGREKKRRAVEKHGEPVSSKVVSGSLVSGSLVSGSLVSGEEKESIPVECEIVELGEPSEGSVVKAVSLSPEKANGGNQRGPTKGQTAVVDDATAARAADFIEWYADAYPKFLKGVPFRRQDVLDFPVACSLVQTWDDARLHKMAEVFLRTDHRFAAEGKRSIRQFNALAEWCDTKLREHNL